MAAIGLVDQSHAERLRQRLCRLCDDNQLFDVVLRSSDGEDLQAHWLILASSSEFFASQTYTPIIYTGIEYNVLSVLVNYIYSGHINITADTKDQILAACEHLKLRDVKNLIQQEMGTTSPFSKQLTSSNGKTHTLDGVDRPSGAKKSRLSKTSKSASNVAQLGSDVFQLFGTNMFKSNVDQTRDVSVVSEVVQQTLSESSDLGGTIIVKQEMDLADDGNDMENESMLEVSMSTPAPSMSGKPQRVNVPQSNSRVRPCIPSEKTDYRGLQGVLKQPEDDDYGEVSDDNDETSGSQESPSHSSIYRRHMKISNPEKYCRYLEKQKLSSQQRRDDLKNALKNPIVGREVLEKKEKMLLDARKRKARYMERLRKEKKYVTHRTK